MRRRSMVGWSERCPECGTDWYREGDKRVNYNRLSDLTVECENCGRIRNIKDDR